MAMKLYADEGINCGYVWEIADMATGAASSWSTKQPVKM
jgi:hypothetical protein